MKNSIKAQLTKKVLLLTCVWFIFMLLLQICLSFVLHKASIKTLLLNKQVHLGSVSILYTDVVRIFIIAISLLPYAIFLMLIVNQIVVRPLREITEELKKLDYNILHQKLDVNTRYEFTKLKDAFNGLLDRVEASESQKKLLITGVAHDLKTPITTIRGYTQALEDSVVTEKFQREEYIHAINLKAKQLDELITLLFDYSKLATTQQQFHFKIFDLCEIIRENIAVYYTEFEERGIKFTFDLPEYEVRLKCDSKQLSRVFSNIYSNALKYNHCGDVVNTRLVLSDGIMIYIEDNGESIEPELAKHIFEPFVSGDSSRQFGSGTGLGLSIAYKIIEMHGGKMKLEANEECEFSKNFIIRL